ncbi:[Fe-Fe] hydrogenase large subunit C-terminal domain-containing protein [Jannaschia seohaensis]|uniref:[Fe-Fe] hydrogenase large subunit C-terminal domain-containing protein n=1 Tax=Jannaschia seohaensis TaxID=475081 RepID=UPI001FE71398|nr:[Fe-Fe] hydrogenase large subunit C-terminal domain-containing protein [Jannaschia seohaensis]
MSAAPAFRSRTSSALPTGAAAAGPCPVFDQPPSATNCISCGQCTLVYPVGAIIEAPHWHDVLKTLDAHRRVSVVQVAPATRVAISEEFGLKPGTVSTGRLINALRQLGFDYVFDTIFAADLTVMEEGSELPSRLRAGPRHPLFTSCCRGCSHRMASGARTATTAPPRGPDAIAAVIDDRLPPRR